MDAKELKQLRDRMTELRDSDKKGSYLDGVDACLAVIDGEINKIELKLKIEKLQADLKVLQEQLDSGKPQEAKPKTGTRGRPKKQVVEEKETE